MPRKLSNVLTPLAVKNAKPGRHADGGGLHLLVKDSGARSWVYRFMLNGKSRDIGLGPAGPGGISLADARTARDALRIKVKAGVDPLEEREREAAASLAAAQAARVAGVTFKQVAEALIDRKEGGWRNAKHRQQWRNTLATYAYPHFGDLPVAEIDMAHVLAVLEPIWTTKPETASRLRGRIENVLDAAKVQRARSGENPARWRGHLDHLLAKPEKLKRGHHPSLPYAQLPDFMADLAGREALAARALEFAILTACRSGEVIGATWAEIDLARALWTIPAERMKAGKEHTVPLSPRVLDILKAVQPLNTRGLSEAPVFPTARGGHLSGMAMSMLLRRMHNASKANGGAGYIDPKAKRMTTVHGFRSTFREWAGEQTAFARETVEHAMAHQLADKAEAAYQRGNMLPKRVKLMEAWAKYCASIPAAGASVTPIRGSTA